MNEARAKRVADRIRETVAQLLETRVKDPRLGFVTVTEVRVTGDLREATVFYTVLGDDEKRLSTKKALDSSNTNNSSYFTEWDYSVKEDELIIFPSYLYHRVKPSMFADSDFRIAIVTNLQIFLPTE